MSEAQAEKLAAFRTTELARAQRVKQQKEEVATSGIGPAGLAPVPDSGPIIQDTPFTLEEDMIPRPTGFRVLVALPQVEETYGGGIVKTDQAMAAEEFSTVVVQVVELGPDAYADKERFPSGAYCKVGDHVIVRAYAGTRFKHHGKELFRIINDDSIEGVVDNPAGLTRI